ncbi:MAG TPA: acyl-CoA dehydrogenase family protein [Steroidobacteraceae bacterium]|jgi:acyl-CoA dehydrogenase|nr:acyl-CoA dehydrogenase family protein [Steroidobacteraceae bacterium]
MDNLLLDSFVRLLGQISPPEAVRRAEADGAAAHIVHEVDESGFLDALVPESKGGSGLSIADVVQLFFAAGEYLLPIPFAETMVARALIAASDAQPPRGRTIILWPSAPGGKLRSTLGPSGDSTSLALVQRDAEFRLLPIKLEERDADPFRMWSASPMLDATPLLQFTLAHVDLLHWSAAITAANMAGAIQRLLAMSLTQVNERQQFGRTLSKFQVIQQQLSVFAERSVSAQVAARIGLVGSELILDGGRVAIAKSVANESARVCASIAHAVHGAMGISEAHDLQLYTRRLARWQISFGSEAYWQKHIGQRRLQSKEPTAVEFVRSLLAAGPETAH